MKWMHGSKRVTYKSCFFKAKGSSVLSIQQALLSYLRSILLSFTPESALEALLYTSCYILCLWHKYSPIIFPVDPHTGSSPKVIRGTLSLQKLKIIFFVSSFFFSFLFVSLLHSHTRETMLVKILAQCRQKKYCIIFFHIFPLLCAMLSSMYVVMCELF